MFENRPIARNTPLHRTLADIAAGVPLERSELAFVIQRGYVDATVVPPILTAEGRRFLDALGPHSSKRET